MKRILTLNSGSSSLKFSLFECGEEERCVFSGNLSFIGSPSGLFVVKDSEEEVVAKREVTLPNHLTAIDVMMKWLENGAGHIEVDAVGHRIVHGGAAHTRPEPLSRDLIGELERLSPFAPSHQPRALETIRAAMDSFPQALHVGCFDTSFHRTMPEASRLLPLPYELFKRGVERFGFHGLSYEFVVSELERRHGTQLASSRLVIAHLGNGSSMAAVHRKKSVDTTMGFSPSGGLVMSTRSGDIDPGLVTYLCGEMGYTAEEFAECVNHKSGLLGISGLTSDMKTLLDEQDRHPGARRAVDVYCHTAAKFLASMSASLGGIDVVVFTGGIGENSPEIRWRITSRLNHLGVAVSERLNADNANEITSGKPAVRTFIIPTNEELMIARHTLNVLVCKVASAQTEP